MKKEPTRHMKKFVVRAFVQLFVLGVLGSTAAPAQPGRPQQEAKPGVTGRPATTQTPAAGSGVITDSVYRNDYFGLRITIPQGWTIQGDDVTRKVKETAKELIVPKDDQNKQDLEAAVERTLNLLTISKFPLAAPGQLNVLVMAVAEAVPLSTTGPAYMKDLKAALQQTTVPVTVVDGEVETINGVRFYTLMATLTPGERVIRQKYYVTMKKGYALGLITSIISESDTEVVNNILKSVTIQ
jgi:hypothetical protein